jgi:hypothetical protein
MLRLVYLSTARLGLESRDLEKLVVAAAAHNRAKSVTGVLLYNGLNFLQVLEGPTAAVDGLYERIRQDQRHSGVTAMRREPIGIVSYPDWGMKLKNIDRASDRLRASQEAAEWLISLSGEDLQRIMESFLSLN